MFYNYRYKEKATFKWVGGVEIKSTHDLPTLLPTPCAVTHKWEGYHKRGSCPEEQGVQDLALGACIRKRRPHNIWL